jgi:hypothetical protein
LSAASNIKNNVSLIVWGITIVTGATGFSLLGGLDTVRSVFSTPDKIEELQGTILQMDTEIHRLQHYQDNAWELSRLMTDDDDSLRWYFLDEGINFDVDIRHTAEDVPLAFVYETSMIYQIYYSSSDNRFYVIVHDHEGGDNENIYLIKK